MTSSTHAVLLFIFCGSASAGALSGRVVDLGGLPVAGVAVSLDRSGAAAVTDAQGKFSLATVSLSKSSPAFPIPNRASAPGFFFRNGRMESAFHGGESGSDRESDAAYSLQGRWLDDGGSGTPVPQSGPAAVAFKSAAWNDTLALAKTAYLTERIAPTSADTNLGDIVLHPAFTGAPGKFLGFDQYNFTVAGKPCLVVVPKKVRAGSPWIWRTYFWAHKPHFDSIMCANGYYLAFMDDPNLYGAPSAVASMNSFYGELTTKYGFSKKTNLVGISRGAFYAYNWGRDNIAKISTLYGDGAGMDLVSWPCGCYGTGVGSAGDWSAAKNVYGFASDAVAKAYRGNPYQNMAPFAAAKIPIIHVYGQADDVAPPNENVLKANDSLKVHGWQMKLLPKPNTGHVHGLDPSDGGLPGQLDTLVQFVLRNTSY
ncbi:MAG: Alpha/beta hydrolase fold-3 domain protein [Fibrobacteres bacterium]|nr:Alpha/beta hydrolase fold-3 domain protein [Fibrobacterota bacterium]